MKRFITTVLFLALAANVFAYPDKPTLGFSQVNWGWSDSEGKSRPVAVDASGAVLITGTMSATISTISATLIDGTATVGSIGAIVNSLPAGTNLLGSVGIDQTTGGVTNGTDPGVNSQASATANPSLAQAVMLYLSDNSTFQRWFTAVVQSDGVNGNNIGTVHGYVYNGSTFDRQRGNSSGTFVIPLPAATGTSITINTSTIAADIPIVAGRMGVFIQNISTESVWIQPWSDVASATFSNSSYVLLQYDTIWFPYGEEIAIGHVSSSPGIIKVDSPVRR